MSTTTTDTDIVEILHEANRGRKPGRLRRKMRLMAADAFSFFRGADPLFGRAWPELAPPDAGPAIWICGDLHLENFGAYRSQAGDFRYDVNDFDEAMVAPCSFDLVRCATSILLAAERWRMTPTQATGMVLTYLEAYRSTVAEWGREGIVGEVAPGGGHGPIWDLLGATASGSQVDLLTQQTRTKPSGKRVIVRSAKHPEVGKDRAKVVTEAIEHHGSKRGQAEAYEVLDLTGRIAGIGSLGVRRYLALVRGDGSPEGNWLLDVKEALPSSVRSCEAADAPESVGNEADRVVAAQTLLQGHPAAGLAAMKIEDRPFRIREMIPEENRSSLDHLQKNPGKLRKAVEVAGRLTGWSQLRGAQFGKGDNPTGALCEWAGSPSLDALLASAVRFADRTIREYREFRHEVRDGAHL